METRHIMMWQAVAVAVSVLTGLLSADYSVIGWICAGTGIMSMIMTQASAATQRELDEWLDGIKRGTARPDAERDQLIPPEWYDDDAGAGEDRT